MAYGDLKVRNLIWNTGSGDNTVVLSTLATQSYVTTNFAPKANPTFTGTINGADLILSGNLTVNGTQTIINTQTLDVEDKQIEIGKVSSPSDTTADQGGIKLKGATDKTFLWVNATDSWTSSENIHLPDNKYLKFGASSDLTMRHEAGGSANITYAAGQGNFYIGADDVGIRNSAQSEWKAKFITNGAVELYHDNSKKFWTNSWGCSIAGAFNLTGNIEGTQDNLKILLGGGNDLQIFHDGTNSRIHNTTGDLIHRTEDQFGWYNAAGSETVATFTVNGSCALYYDNSKKFETTSTGVTVTGTVSDSKGDLRKIIQNTQGSAYTLVAGDAGKHILASGNITIPNSVFAAGDGVVIVNNTSGDLTITSTITNLYLGLDGSTGNKKLASRCTCTVLFTSGTAGYISGGGLTAA